MNVPRLRIVHETNPRKYFPALFALAQDGRIELAGAHRYSVVKEWLRAWLVDKTPLSQRSRNAWGDLLFRLRIPFVKRETILLGFAPWDWRLLIYRHLARHNRILYHTSWHDWRFDMTPRQLRPSGFQRLMQRQWHAFVHHPNVSVITITPLVAETLKTEVGVASSIITHSVPQAFFDAGRKRSPRTDGPLRLIYVGEVSEKKGILILLDLMKELHTRNVSLTVVGNGPLVPQVRKAASEGVTYLDPIYDREKLAATMAEHDVLMLLSQKTPTWEELFGIVIVEALATGLAVLAADHVGPREILSSVGGTGLLESTSKDVVSAKVLALATDRRNLQDLADRQSGVANAYSLNIVAETWLSKIISVNTQETSGEI